VESERESLVVASLGACRFGPGGEAGWTGVPEELDPELESARVSWAAAGPVEVPVGSFVLLEVSVSESAAASEEAAPEASAGAAEGSAAVAPSVVSVASGAVAHVSVVPAAAADVSVVMAEVSVASGAVAHASVVSAVPEPSVVVAEVSEVTLGAVPFDDAVDAASLGIESDVAEPSETDGGPSSARAVAANRDAQSRAASTASVQPTNPRLRRRSNRGG
jgi:hypothetical protein